MSNNQQLTTNNNNEDITNINSTSSDNLNLNLSTTNETVVDEEERRRILENILNDNDDSVSDEDENVSLAAFMNVAQSRQGAATTAQQVVGGDKEPQDESNEDNKVDKDRIANAKKSNHSDNTNNNKSYLSSSSEEEEDDDDDDNNQTQSSNIIPQQPEDLGSNSNIGSYDTFQLSISNENNNDNEGEEGESGIESFIVENSGAAVNVSGATKSSKGELSAFDKALTEVQQGRSSRSNSFTFNDNVSDGVDEGADSSNKERAPAEKSEKSEATTSQEKDVTNKNTNDNDDDFFAKAEHTVLDEIIHQAEAANDEIDAADEAAANESRQQQTTNNSSSSSKGSSSNVRVKDRISLHTNSNSSSANNNSRNNSQSSAASNALPDVLSSMRQKIESFNIFDDSSNNTNNNKSSSSISGPPPSLSSSTITNRNKIIDTPITGSSNNNTSTASSTLQKYYNSEEEREAMRRTFQQSISAAVLVSLAHKRYERRRLAAMEIEKVVRSLVIQDDYNKVRAILLLLSDDYVRSTNEDARKGGAVALAACAIGLKKANEKRRDVIECRDLILASVVHACQDHSQRVRYYATESLFNVTKVIPSLAVQHFFILFEILRSLYADVDLDVRSGAELLDKKLKEVIVGAINSGSFSADACVPVFARFVYMRNKATKQLTLTWLKEFSEKLVGAPILEFLHLFLGGIFQMVADPNATSQLALEFLQSVLPKLLDTNEEAFEDAQQKVDFDKILQSLVLTMEHPDPFVRKVAMYWMSRIVQAHMSSAFPSMNALDDPDEGLSPNELMKGERSLTAASISVRNALPHVLPGILLSIGDTHQSRAKDSFLPDQTTHSLAEQANTCLQDAVRRDGQAFIPHLGGFIVALREELDSPGGLIARQPPSIERRPYRMDVKADGSGIESTGWFRASDGVEERDNALILSRLCALQWVVVLYEHVVPNSLKADYAGEFIDCIIYQLVDQPPGIIIVKSFEVLAKISNPAEGEEAYSLITTKSALDENASTANVDLPSRQSPMDDDNANFALEILNPSRRRLLSRDRSVFASLIDLHSKHQKLLMDISKVIELMCTLQPAEFIFVSFAIELDNFIITKLNRREKLLESPEVDTQTVKEELATFAKDLAFVSNFAQQLGIVFFAAPETEQLRTLLKDSIGFKADTVGDERRARLFHILLYTFSHNIVATLGFCLWGGACLTASTFLQMVDPLDVSLMFYLEIDQLIDLIERPLFRHLHLRMLECEDDPYQEGSGAMLFRTLKSILMLLPQSTSYMILKERLTSMARYRQSAVALSGLSKHIEPDSETDIFVKRILSVRRLHCDAKWRNIRAESLEEPCRFVDEDQKLSAAQQRREWLGYADEEDEIATREQMKKNMLGDLPKKVEMVGVYENLNEMEKPQQAQYNKKEEDEEEECEQCLTSAPTTQGLIQQFERMNNAGEEGKEDKNDPQWREYWASRQ